MKVTIISLFLSSVELERRIDFELREGLVESRYWSAVTSHTGYWCSHDIALFLLTFIYKQNVPSDPAEDNLEPDWGSSLISTHTHLNDVIFFRRCRTRLHSFIFMQTNCSNTLIIPFFSLLSSSLNTWESLMTNWLKLSFQDVHFCLFLCSLYTISHPKGDCIGPGTPKEVHPLPVWPQAIRVYCTQLQKVLASSLKRQP